MLRALPRFFKYIARRKALALAIVMLLPIVIRLVAIPKHPVPLPNVADEFSYLLAADTFASGHLANPVHPHWKFFEYLHVIHVPVYASKYPPFQGLLLAAGQLLTGIPWAGVLASGGMMCGAIFWMLYGWMERRYALMGALLAVTQLATFGYWMDSYMGGFLPAIGGALVMGSLPRLLRRTDWFNSIPLGLGATVLLNTRPFEGAVLLLACGSWLLWKLPILRWIRLAPAAAVVCLCVSWILFYNNAVSGSPFKLPYAVHEQQYAVASPFLFFEAPRPVPHYFHNAIKVVWADYDLGLYRTQRANLLTYYWESAQGILKIFAGEGLLLILLPLGVFAAFRRQRFRPPLLFALVAIAGLAIVKAILPHYAAPVTGLFFLFYALSLRQLDRWAVGLPISSMLMVATFAAYLAQVGMVLAGPRMANYSSQAQMEAADRQKIVEKLQGLGGNHLVMVRYETQKSPLYDYVYNGANIDGSPIVWARYMNPTENGELLRYYKDRRIWFLQVPITGTPDLRPYSTEQFAEARR